MNWIVCMLPPSKNATWSGRKRVRSIEPGANSLSRSRLTRRNPVGNQESKSEHCCMSRKTAQRLCDNGIHKTDDLRRQERF